MLVGVGALSLLDWFPLSHPSLPNADPRERMKESGNIQYPQNDSDDYDAIQD
jgi:hypothetical protein